MKIIKSLMATVLVLSTVNLSAQNLTAKQQLRENNEVELFTEKEKVEIQLWFNQEIESMNLDEQTRSAYESNLLVYTSKMMRLDDKDNDYTSEEIKNKFDDIVEELNKKMVKLLKNEQYEIHEFNFKILTNYVKVRLDTEITSVPTKGDFI